MEKNTFVHYCSDGISMNIHFVLKTVETEVNMNLFQDTVVSPSL